MSEPRDPPFITGFFDNLDDIQDQVTSVLILIKQGTADEIIVKLEELSEVQFDKPLIAYIHLMLSEFDKKGLINSEEQDGELKYGLNHPAVI